MKEKDIQKLKCNHNWVTEIDGADSVIYCTKCMVTKSELKHLKDLATMKPLTEFDKKRVCEKMSLKEKLEYVTDIHPYETTKVLKFEDVLEAVQEFLEWLDDTPRIDHDDVRKKIKEVFG